jgi:hypothetical protein
MLTPVGISRSHLANPAGAPERRSVRGEQTEAVQVFVGTGAVPEGRYLSVIGSPLRGQDGALEGGVVVFRDVTAAREAEESFDGRKSTFGSCSRRARSRCGPSIAIRSRSCR